MNMFGKGKTVGYIAVIGFVIVGGIAFNNSCHAMNACACARNVCIPDRIQQQGVERMKQFCVEEGNTRANSGWKEHQNCPLDMNAPNCMTLPMQ